MLMKPLLATGDTFFVADGSSMLDHLLTATH